MSDGATGMSAPDAARMSSSAARGTVWAIAGFGGAQLLRVLGNVLLTRLLFREAFGLMALVSVFLQGLQMFSDLGIGPSVIQNPRGNDRSFLDTAWTLQALRGLVLSLICVGAAVPFARLLGAPELAPLLPWAGLTAFVSGLSSTKPWTLNRELAMGRIEVMELATQAITLVATILWAWWHPTVWALVGGTVIGSALKCVASHLALPGPGNRPRVERAAAGALLRFGRWIFLSTLLGFFAAQSDRLLFSQMIPLGLLGVYSIGVTLAGLPGVAIGHLCGRILFPLWAGAVNRGEPLGPLFRRTRRPFLLLTAWSIAGLIAGGPTLIDLLYDDRYQDAGYIVRLIALGGWFSVLEAQSGAALLATGRARWIAVAAAAKVVTLAGAMLAGHRLAGFPGALVGVALGEAAKYLGSLPGARRAGVLALDQDARYALLIGAGTAAGWLAVQGARGLAMPRVVEGLLVAVVVTSVFLPAALPMVRQARRDGVRSLFA